MKRKIAIFTGNRAEYGLQFPIIKALKKNKEITTQIIVSGSHLDKKYGNTIKEIQRDKLKVNYKVKLIKYNNKKKLYTPILISDAVKKISLVLNKIKPDIMMINADRYETFAACIASTQMNIPTFHVEGGDITNGGTFDDSVRHAITKLSHIHFATNLASYKNIISMGEEKWRVFNVGLPINDTILSSKKESRIFLEKKFKINFSKPLIIFTYHPISSNKNIIEKDIKINLEAINLLIIKNNCQIIATYPNNDFGSEFIIKEINKFSLKNPKFFNVHKSLSSHYLHSIMQCAKLKNFSIMGNSSMGIKEAIVFKCPAVNIGSRQNGRLKPYNVIDVEVNKNKIVKAVRKALFNIKFKKKILKSSNPYFKKNTGINIVKIVSKISINKKLLEKKTIIKN